MKKVLTLATVMILAASVAFAADKGKGKKKCAKTKSECCAKTATKKCCAKKA